MQKPVQHDIEGVIPNLFRNLNVFNEHVTILNTFVLTLIRFANHHNIFFELMGSFAEMEA